MKVKGLDGREYSWGIASKPRKNVSKHHLRARELLKKIYPCDVIAEELPLPGTKTSQNRALFADFYLHTRRIMVEVQGEQHSKYVAHFHNMDKRNFHKGKMRDATKREWCLLNNITLITLPYNEDEKQWENRIRNLGDNSES
jgi:hypothetical protein